MERVNDEPPAIVRRTEGVTTEVSTVRLGNGPTLSYAEQGDRSGPVLVLLPGPTDSWWSYRVVLERIPLAIRTIAVSQRGHGDSDKPATGYRVEDFAADVVSLLDALRIERAVLAGHSGSCLIARRVALDRPERVAGLVLEASPTTLLGDAALEEFVESIVSGLEDPIDRDFARSFVIDTSSAEVGPEVLDQLVGELLKAPAHVWREMFAGLLQYDDMAELGRITAPTLLIWGDADGLVGREMQEQLAGRMSCGDLVVYPGVGHTPRWEDPSRFASDVAAFVARLLPAGDAVMAGHQEAGPPRRERAHGFTDVDGQADPSQWVETLDVLSREPFYRTYKDRLLALVGAVPGGRYLDVGAGTGADADNVAACGADVVAFDYSRVMMAVAHERRALPAVVGDAHRLPFPAATFDGCWSDRTLQHLIDPAAALAELARVTKPGATIAVADPDYDTQVVSFADDDLAHRIRRFRTGRMIRNGSLAHRIVALFDATGLTDPRVEAMTLVVRDPSSVDNVMGLRSWADAAAAQGELTDDEAARWRTQFDAAAAGGRFLYAVTFFLTVGAVPKAVHD